MMRKIRRDMKRAAGTLAPIVVNPRPATIRGFRLGAKPLGKIQKGAAK